MPSWEDVPDDIKKRFPSPPEKADYSCDEDHEEALGFWHSRVGRNLGMVMQQYNAERKKVGESAQIKTELEWITRQNLKGLNGNQICQCGTEKLISHSTDPKRLRASLLALIFVSQFVYTHYQKWHSEFYSEFPIPKLREHSLGIHAHAVWFVDQSHGFDKMADWELTSRIFRDCVNHLQKWLQERGEMETAEFKNLIEMEIRTGFSKDQAEYFKVH